MLPDILEHDLRIVFCGTAVGEKSATLQMYYAGPGNRFWKVLIEVGLTPVRLEPKQYAELPKYGLGLTDLVKNASGPDSRIDFTASALEVLRSKVLKFQPGILCFNGKKAAKEFPGRSVHYGLQRERIQNTRLFVTPSTSGAANGYWDVEWWFELVKSLPQDHLDDSDSSA